MRRVLGWALIALALTVSAGCAAYTTGPIDPMAVQGKQIWDCGWRTL